LKVPSRNNTEDRLRKNTQKNGCSNRVSPATNARQQKENDKKWNDKKMKEQTAVHSRITPALVAYFFVPHFFVIKSFFLTRGRSQSDALQRRPKSSKKNNSWSSKGRAFLPDSAGSSTAIGCPTAVRVRLESLTYGSVPCLMCHCLMVASRRAVGKLGIPATVKQC
jgi:hypothetical protein